MRAITARRAKSLQHRSNCFCTDNSGAKEVRIISVIGLKTRKKMSPKAGIADMITVVITKGKPEMRKKVERAIIVRTKKEFRRPDGMRIKFEDNAVVLVDEKGLPKASEIKGAIAKEVGERWPKIAGIAAAVV